MNETELAKLRRLSHVPRWVVVPTIQKQSVAEHSLNVLGIFMLLCEKMGIKVTALDIEDIVLHDSEEAVTGDNPSPTKPFEVPEDASLMWFLTKMADLLEAIHFLMDEQALGNQAVEASLQWLGRRLEIVEDAFSVSEHAPEDFTQLPIEWVWPLHRHPVLEV